MNLQLYLLEGLTRWNEDRGRAAVEGGDRQLQRSYSSRDLDTLNQLSQSLYGNRLVDSFTQPREYTGEEGGRQTDRHTLSHTQVFVTVLLHWFYVLSQGS